MKTILFYLSFQPIYTKYQSIKKFRITLSGYTEFLLSICYRLFYFLKSNMYCKSISYAYLGTNMGIL